jgi:hypothetical protein
MADLVAKIALRKARYFLKQAKDIEANPGILAERLPFTANLEAAIVYARSSLHHLKNELAPTHKNKGYKRWHEEKQKALEGSNLIFEYLVQRRNVIIHQEPLKTNAKVSIEMDMSISASMFAEVTITRADGTIERDNFVPLAPRTEKKISPPGSSSQAFFFSDHEWRAKPAVDYVHEFIDACENFISEAERKFL